MVGGLYGNEPALSKILELFDRERGTKCMVFNGDFNWFNVDPASFERINQTVLSFPATRGNVETELGDDASEGGCGCAYPDWVDDEVVHRSNDIMLRLRETAQRFPALVTSLTKLPMHMRIDVGGRRVGIVHGDAESLSGWGFAQERLRDPGHHAQLESWFAQAQVEVFASSHTCLPVFHTLQREGSEFAPAILNNGAAGMPNFADTSYGVITRIAASTKRPDKVIGMHFMNPVPVMQLVELIRGIATDAETWEALHGVVRKLGKTAASAEDFPAFIVNRILVPMINEAFFVLAEGLATAEDIDAGITHQVVIAFVTREVVSQRAANDAIMVGAGTVRSDDPEINASVAFNGKPGIQGLVVDASGRVRSITGLSELYAAGDITVNAGKIRVGGNNIANALGSLRGTTTINAGATLEHSHVVGDCANQHQYKGKPGHFGRGNATSKQGG